MVLSLRTLLADLATMASHIVTTAITPHHPIGARTKSTLIQIHIRSTEAQK